MRRIFLMLLLLVLTPSAHALYKCKSANGGIEYQSDPCTTSADVTPQSVKSVPNKAKQYVGERIKLNFSNVDIRALLQVIADFSGRPIRTGAGVQGNIAAHYDAPWDQVLDQLAMRYGLAITIGKDEILVDKKP